MLTASRGCTPGLNIISLLLLILWCQMYCQDRKLETLETETGNRNWEQNMEIKSKNSIFIINICMLDKYPYVVAIS